MISEIKKQFNKIQASIILIILGFHWMNSDDFLLNLMEGKKAYWIGLFIYFFQIIYGLFLFFKAKNKILTCVGG
jgi:hypothetical protein